MSGTGRAPDVVFSHFGLYCTDFERMKDFYTRVLGFAISDQGSSGRSGLSMAFMTRRPFEHHQLVLAGGRAAHLPSTVNQLGFAAPGLDELRRIRSLLEAEDGVSDIATADHGISWALYFRDPNGNRVAVTVETGWFVPQPVIWPLDLSLSDQAIVAETGRRCRKTPGFETRAAWRAQIAERLAADGRLAPQATPPVDAAATAEDERIFEFDGEDAPPAEPYPRIAMRGIGLYAVDLAALTAFYADMLGYVVTGRGQMEAIGGAPAAEYVFLTRDPDQFAQITLCSGRAADTPSSVQQLTFRLPSFDQLRGVDRLLRETDGVSEVVDTNHGNSFSVYCIDPEGNRLELSLESEWYVPAPIAWPLDLSLPDGDILRTTEEKCRSAAGFMMREAWKSKARTELVRTGRLEAE